MREIASDVFFAPKMFVDIACEDRIERVGCERRQSVASENDDLDFALCMFSEVFFVDVQCGSATRFDLVNEVAISCAEVERCPLPIDILLKKAADRAPEIALLTQFLLAESQAIQGALDHFAVRRRKWSFVGLQPVEDVQKRSLRVVLRFPTVYRGNRTFDQ